MARRRAITDICQQAEATLLMVVAEDRAGTDSLTSAWSILITLVGAPDDVVESAETSDEGGIHLIKEMVQKKTLY